MIVDAGTFILPKLPAFIVIEGVNGAGKSTLQRELVSYFADKQLPCVSTREPGATELGKKLRALVLDEKSERMCELAELFIFAADRSEHVSKLISPSLAQGKTVISDRYYYSSVAFQGHGRGINRNIVEAINCMAINGVVPHLLILLDLDPADGLRRNRADSKKKADPEQDAFELEELAFHTRLRNGFIEFAKRIKEPCITIDASQPKEAVWNTVKGILDRSFNGQP